jgi:hypothetical protein
MAQQIVEYLRLNSQSRLSTRNREFVQLKFSWDQNLSPLLALLQR